MNLLQFDSGQVGEHRRRKPHARIGRLRVSGRQRESPRFFIDAIVRSG
jgi:hypothetical protein